MSLSLLSHLADSGQFELKILDEAILHHQHLLYDSDSGGGGGSGSDSGSGSGSDSGGGSGSGSGSDSGGGCSHGDVIMVQQK